MKQPVIYSIYLRNHTIEGTFKEAQKDIPRIAELGVDIVWLLPFYENGQMNKKGVLGSPYSIRNYCSVSEEYGTMEDFEQFRDAVHSKGMKLLIDIVYNHTAFDHDWTTHRPDFYNRDENGNFVQKVQDWHDIIDLNYNNRDLWNEQLKQLQFWLSKGVDGFRCDVASMVPIQFWEFAKRELVKVKPDIVMLAESVEPLFITTLRRDGYLAHSDGEMYTAFDFTYDYDVHQFQKAFFEGHIPFSVFHEKVRQQQYLLPDGGYKLRFVENHDQPRIESFCDHDEEQKLQWLAWMYFQRGAALLYAGVETTNVYTPTLFDREPIEWTELNSRYARAIQSFKKIKENDVVLNGYYEVDPFEREGLFVAKYTLGDKVVFGYFNTDCNEKWVRLPNNVRFREAKNVLTGEKILLDKALILRDEPFIFEVTISRK